MSKEIPLTQGKIAIVDDEDYEFLSQWRWQYTGGYARRTVYHGRDENGKRIRDVVWMHRLIANPPDGMVVDHINGNEMDNRRDNLRVCTNKDNLRNQKRNKDYGYKGVTKHSNHTWLVRLVYNKETIRIGVFSDEVASANAYNYYAQEYFGEFARLNEVPYMEKEEWMSYRRSKDKVSDIIERTS